MSKIKRTLVAATGVVVGAVTFRKLRQRRQSATDEEVEAELSKSPKTEVAEEAKAAATHARAAGEKAGEYAREQVETVRSR